MEKLKNLVYLLNVKLVPNMVNSSIMSSPLFQEKQIVIMIVYHLNIFIIILLWLLYPFRYDIFFIIVSLCLFLIFCPIITWREYLKDSVSISDQAIYIIFIYFSFLYLFDASAPYDTMLLFFLFPFDKLVGIAHTHNILLFFLLFSLVFLKLLPIKVKFISDSKIKKSRTKSFLFQYITEHKNTSKTLLLVLLIPLSAFVEEFIYRTLIFSFLIELFKLNLLLSFVIVAVVFGAVHITTSKNWEMFFITFFSSLIYSFALIFLGIFYAWILHLSNNLIALFFYYSEKKKGKTLDQNLNPPLLDLDK